MSNDLLRAKLYEIADNLTDEHEFSAVGIILSGAREIVSACVKPANSEVSDSELASMIARGVLKESKKPTEVTH